MLNITLRKTILKETFNAFVFNEAVSERELLNDEIIESSKIFDEKVSGIVQGFGNHNQNILIQIVLHTVILLLLTP